MARSKERKFLGFCKGTGIGSFAREIFPALVLIDHSWAECGEEGDGVPSRQSASFEIRSIDKPAT